MFSALDFFPRAFSLTPYEDACYRPQSGQERAFLGFFVAVVVAAILIRLDPPRSDTKLERDHSQLGDAVSFEVQSKHYMQLVKLVLS